MREFWVLGSESEWSASAGTLSDALQPWSTRVVATDYPAETVPAFILLVYQGWQAFLSRLKMCKQRWAEAPVMGLVPVEELQSEQLGAAYREGLEDFVSTPVRMPELIARLRCFCAQDRPELPPPDLDEWKREHHLQALIGSSPAFVAALRRIPTLGSSNATVLIQGETGTGKELFARALHYSSARSAAAFVPVNCGALPDQLFENELFGHARGAYTDARGDSLGLLEVAEGGTLFLDEVDSLSPLAQVKLLRLLQTREYRPLGSAQMRVADIRVIAAANSDLTRLVEQGRLRQDLFYRLNVLRIFVPPLRERPSDILQLAHHFLTQLGRTYNRNGLRLGPAAAAQMAAHRWPGNVRELESVMQRVVLIASSGVLQPADLELGCQRSNAGPVTAESGSMREAKNLLVEEFERNYLEHLLDRCRGNVSLAAREAGKDRRAFQRLMQKRGVRL
jgi:DNA-binding NtrC family response regulator